MAIGHRVSGGELIALLNNDTVAQPRWLAALVEAIQEDPRMGGDRGFRQPDRGQYDEPADVFGACGASVLLRRELLEDVGLFDERLFMYGEDLDLAWRA